MWRDAIDGYYFGAIDPNKTSLERAFELAASGKCRSVDDVKKMLNAEGYDQAAVYGLAMIKQLRGIMLGTQTGQEP